MRNMVILTGRANPVLAEKVAALLGTAPGKCRIEDFPDEEIHVSVQENVRHRDVYVIQPTSPPATKNLFELLLLADACRRDGAARLTAVIPYFGYARQDRRKDRGEPVSARLIADFLRTAPHILRPDHPENDLGGGLAWQDQKEEKGKDDRFQNLDHDPPIH